MSAAEGRPDEPLVEPLTRRESEILGLLDQGLSAPEMAERLTLAVSSVKWHLRHLYEKLGVNGKRPALNRAQALGLLGGGVQLNAPTAESHDDFSFALSLAVVARVRAAQGLWVRRGRKPSQIGHISLDTLLPGWRDGPNAAAIMQAFEAGQAMSVDEAMDYALSDTSP